MINPNQRLKVEQGIELPITIHEKYVERPDGIYYLWRLSTEKEWHEKLTGHKETPYVSFRYMMPYEFEEFKKKLDEPLKVELTDLGRKVLEEMK